MNDDTTSSLGSPPTVAWPALLVALAALYGWLTFQPPLDSARLTTEDNPYPRPPVPQHFKSVHARLWEDPLRAAGRGEPSDSSSAEDADSLLMRWIAPRGSTGDREAAWKVLDAVRPESGEMLILPVLLPGGPSTDDSEQRKRIRYAVLSALNTCGFRLSFPDRMTYVDVPVAVQVAGSRLPPKRIRVPTKLFALDHTEPFFDDEDGDGPKDRKALVLWINESQLGSKPLTAIYDILAQLVPPRKVRPVQTQMLRIIGPANSDTLMSMAIENSTWPVIPSTWPEIPKLTLNMGGLLNIGGVLFSTGDWFKVPNFKIWDEEAVLLSPRSTIWGTYMRNEGSSTQKPEESFEAFTGGDQTTCGLRVVRTIGTDELLVAALEEELRLRQAWPREKVNDECIVLVTEKDTLYGRNLPKIFEHKFESDYASPHEQRCALIPLQRKTGADADKLDHLTLYTFLRGIDGVVPNESAKKPSNSSQRDQNEQTATSEVRSVGRAQLDYLQRLQQTLTEIDRCQRRRGGRGILAIGVVGTDLYDKFLVLRALRNRFRDTVFFTTDLDAEMTDPRELRTTQNLVVASHFGLQLHPDLQRDVAPFRDNYQTATYLTTLMAVGDRRAQDVTQQKLWRENGDDPSGLSPLVFEIGRRVPYQLTMTREVDFPTSSIHPPSPREVNHPSASWLARWWFLISITLIGLALIFINTTRQIVDQILKPQIGGSLLALAAVAVLLGLAISRDHTAEAGEPFVLWEGVSIWPTTILRYLASTLVALFFVISITDLKNNRTGKLRDKFTGELPPATSPEKGRWRRLLDYLLVRWPDPLQRPGKYSVREAFAYYYRDCALGATAVRVGVITVTLLLFAASVFCIFDYPRVPVRGYVSFWLGLTALLLSIGGAVALCVFVIDATEVCRRFVRRLVEDTGAWPVKERLTAYKEGRPTTDRSLEDAELYFQRPSSNVDDLSELLKVRVIAERTNVVGKLVQYPFIVLMLLILSRHPVFDAFPLTIPVVFLSGAVFVALLIVAFNLKREARRAQATVIDRLRDSLSNAIGEENKIRENQLRALIDEISHESRGAFRPISRDYLFRGLAIPLGGVSTLLVLEHFAQ